ncbi:MAG: aspartate/tyrosine/aromatic aminotransferase [Gammaproteobacteria bacterium]|nr:aspartate/tyrosine/aromatic aminotransferase [Gammaproteobacteria bacterium]MDH5239927.1 aspartate/tyrosine/aromatic aminotransferase [Gammaproteobacteria bacterium]MDH5262836.1 aspartate/tyrosine/aromatic aminotransferase [Gammaproteobacteria bacterium]MDH5621777.1 aspartate/tyrosine/aromatic aminotransferase [Gammaproteobacteria bacterium]
MFESLKAAPADAILGLIAEYRDDPRPDKIDLGVGVYRTRQGETPVLKVVKRAEQVLVDTQKSKTYIGTAGAADFNAAMQALTFGDSKFDDRLATLQTPGGSGSLRVAAGMILRASPDAAVWVSEPTWANHIPLLGGAGVNLTPYPYYDTKKHVIRIDEMIAALRSAPAGDIVLLHACCHNPSGLDPSMEEWQAIADVIVKRKLIPFIDIAYQGFAHDLDRDAYPIRLMAERVPEMIVSSSCSKNFGLYRDRVGTLSLLAANRASRDIVNSQVNNLVRTIYSVPPDHGAAVVSLILNDQELRRAWIMELEEMRERLQEMRTLLSNALVEKMPGRDFSHLVRATGMFCFLGITAAEVARLKQEFGIYMVDSSRINVAGITPDNVSYLAESIAATLQNR